MQVNHLKFDTKFLKEDILSTLMNVEFQIQRKQSTGQSDALQYTPTNAMARRMTTLDSNNMYTQKHLDTISMDPYFITSYRRVEAKYLLKQKIIVFVVVI